MGSRLALRPALAFTVTALVFVCGCGSSRSLDGEGVSARGPRFQQLKAVRTWAYQIQGLEYPARRQALYASDYDLFVVEPMRTTKGMQGFGTRQMVSRLKNAGGQRRLVLAYVDIGEAERWRTYWKSWWQAPRAGQPGNPSFLVAPDPDGWSGCFPLAYWDPRWQAIIATGSDSVLRLLLDDGFDGIYMDWVEAYDDDKVAARARGEGRYPAAEMIRFIRTIRQRAQERDPDFLVVAQNAPDLISGRSAYVQVIDGMAQEDLHYGGEADVGWNDPRSGGIPTPATGEWGTAWLQQRLDQYLAAGLPVLVVDYCVKEQHRLACYRMSRTRGYVPFISRTPLDRLPAAPPSWEDHLAERHRAARAGG